MEDGPPWNVTMALAMGCSLMNSLEIHALALDARVKGRCRCVPLEKGAKRIRARPWIR